MRVGLNDPALLQNPGFHSCCLHQVIARLLCGLRLVMVARIHQAPGDCLHERVHSLQMLIRSLPWKKRELARQPFGISKGQETRL